MFMGVLPLFTSFIFQGEFGMDVKIEVKILEISFSYNFEHKSSMKTSPPFLLCYQADPQEEKAFEGFINPLKPSITPILQFPQISRVFNNITLFYPY